MYTMHTYIECSVCVNGSDVRTFIYTWRAVCDSVVKRCVHMYSMCNVMGGHGTSPSLY